jgi:hypothetical protein
MTVWSSDGGFEKHIVCRYRQNTCLNVNSEEETPGCWPSKSNQIKCIYEAPLTSADISKCCTETQPKTPNRKKPREKPGYEGWPVLFWLCWVEIITEHGQYVQMFINDQQGQIIVITVKRSGFHSRRQNS